MIGRANQSIRVSSRPVNEPKVGCADLHIHTTLSDGAATPAQVANVLARSDLAVAAVTDHDTVEGALRVRDALAGRGPEIVTGTEVTSADGHIQALFVDHDVPAGLSARETVEIIHERGGLAIAAHVYFPIVGVGRLAHQVPFDGVEVANGTPLGELANRLASRRFAGSARARLGGSDAHLLAAIGHVRTHFAGHTAADLRAAIERGDTWPAFDWGVHLRTGPRMVGWMAWCILQDIRRAVRPAHGSASPAAPPSTD
jgi:predicted metal-dependent phosphoesterase TrpH